MRYLLDTCVISELIKPKPDAGVVRWIRGHDEESLLISAITLGEISKGISKLPSSGKKTMLEEWANKDLRERFSARTLPITEEIAILWGTLLGSPERQGRRLPVVDVLLAATALSHGLTLVTRDTSGIEKTGAIFLNPWG